MLRQSVHESLCQFCQIETGRNIHHLAGLQRKSRRLLVCWAGNKCLARREGARGVLSLFTGCTRCFQLLLPLLWTCSSSLVAIERLCLLPLLHDCSAETARMWPGASGGGRAATRLTWSAEGGGGGRKEPHFFLQQRTEKSLVSYAKLPQEKGLRTHVIEHPWDSASSLRFSARISDQRYWGLEGSGNIIAGKYRLNEINWRHSAVKKKKTKKTKKKTLQFNFLSKLE